MPRRDSNLEVIKISGSLFFSDKLREMVRALRNLASRNESSRLILVCGGGAHARKFIEAGRKLGADQASLDEIGILVSRLNASVLRAALGKTAFSSVPESLGEIAEIFEASKPRIIVTGGLHPGQSTNAVAALISEKLRATRFINSTDVDAVYTKDPRRFKDAKRLKRVTIEQLAKILGDEPVQAGAYDLMDPVALKLIERSKIPTVIIKCDPIVLRDVLQGRRQHGTIIAPK